MKRASRGAVIQLGRKKPEAGKSELTVLAERFKQHFCTLAESIGKDLNLNEVAHSLQVSRRRLYDIINVLEALQMVSRNGKLTYRWKGTSHLPKLLAELYTDGIAALESGQCNPAILEGHMPGSCWALTRRIVQQLLLDRGQVPLTVLVQRLEEDTVAATDDSTVVKTSAATVERRIYDIGSVLSTYDLVSKTLQGGSGPRHRQPVYQWLYDWESQLPAGMLQAAAPAMTDVAEVAAAMPSMEHLQQWQEYQAATATAAAAAAAEAGAMYTSSEAAQQQQQLLLQLAGYAADLQGGSSAFWEQTVTAQTQVQQQQQQQSQSAPAPGSPAVAADTVQQSLQQVSSLVNAMLAEHGKETCVTLSQLQGLLQHIQAGIFYYDVAAVAATVADQQQGQQPVHGHIDSVDNQHEDQEQLDAAKCLQQLKAGALWPERPGYNEQQQQQQVVDDRNAQGADDTRRSSKKRRVCMYVEPESNKSNDQCCPGMTCLDFSAALRAVADSQLQQRPASSDQQQSPGCPSSAELGAAKDDNNTEGVCYASTVSGRTASLSCSRGNQADADQDDTAFVGEEGEAGPGLRVSSSTLNNSRDQSAMQELAAAAAAVASLQQQRTAADKPNNTDGVADEGKVPQECRADAGCFDKLTAGVQQQDVEMIIPWVGQSTAEIQVVPAGMPGVDGSSTVSTAGREPVTASTAGIAVLAQKQDQARSRIMLNLEADEHLQQQQQQCQEQSDVEEVKDHLLQTAGGVPMGIDHAAQLRKTTSGRTAQVESSLLSPWQALQQLQQLTSVHSGASNSAAVAAGEGDRLKGVVSAATPANGYAAKGGCDIHDHGWSLALPTAAVAAVASSSSSSAPRFWQCAEQQHDQQYQLVAGGAAAVQGLLNCLPASMLTQLLQARAES